MGKKLGLDKAYSNLLTTINKNSPTNLSGKGLSTNTPLSNRPTINTKVTGVVKNVAKSVFNRSPIGRIIDAGVKIGAGVGAGYSYAKEKFKPDNKMVGGMAENRGMGLQDESMKPGKIMKVKYGKMVKK